SQIISFAPGTLFLFKTLTHELWISNNGFFNRYYLFIDQSFDILLFITQLCQNFGTMFTDQRRRPSYSAGCFTHAEWDVGYSKPAGFGMPDLYKGFVMFYLRIIFHLTLIIYRRNP